jgi:hypothetical protein
MSRGRLLAIAGLAAAFIAAFVLVATRGGGGSPVPKRAVAVRTSIAPSPVLFGDLVTARAEVLVDRERVDPDTVRIAADFKPYSIVGTPRESRSESGHAVTIDVRYTLHCLVEACLPQSGGVVLPKLRVHTKPSSDSDVEYSQSWPRIDVVSRVEPTALATDPPPWRRETALPPVSYRLGPGPLALALTLGAVVLSLGAFTLVGWELSRRRRTLLERARFRSALSRALELARASVARSPDDRRRALALLARVLAFDPDGGRRLAPAAARLAWGRAEPSPAGLASLLEEIERTVPDR